MGIGLELVDFEVLLHNTLIEPIMINHYDINDTDSVETVNELLLTSYSDSALEVAPSCDCGDLKGEFLVNTTCTECGTICTTVVDRPIESAAWISTDVMEGIDCFVSPIVWTMLRNFLTIGGVSILDWLANPRYKPPTITPEIEKLENIGMTRGYNFFCDNFHSIMDTVLNKRIITSKPLKKRKIIEDLINENSGLIFTRYLPIPSKIAFIKEDTDTGSYTDPTMVLGLDAVHTFRSITQTNIDLQQVVKESRMVAGLNKITDYFNAFFTDSLAPKKGWFRKHVYGTRLHFSFRGVITSITEPHTYDEIHLPWSMAVGVLKTHIISKLLKLGFKPNAALRFVKEHTLKYDALMDQILEELIAESPYGGIPFLFGRNPTLTRGSVACLRITKIIKDIRIKSIRISVLILIAYNADFDGDALNGFILPDNKMYQRAKRLAPHNYVLDNNIPRKISKFLTLPTPVGLTMSNFINDPIYLERIT